MADSVGSLYLELSARTDKLEKNLRTSLRNVEDAVNANGKRLERSMSSRFKKIAAIIGGAFAIKKTKDFFQGALKEAANFEQGLIKVVKTTDLAGKQLFEFEKGIEALERKIPATSEQLLTMAEVAGQMGVRGSKSILKFTETMTKLESATDVAGEQGARSLVRLLNITGEGVGVIDRFGSAVVALGNSAATTESEIIHMASFIGQSIGTFVDSSAEVAGLSTAIKELGGRAESAGSALGRTFTIINEAIQIGGEKSAKVADALGVSVEQLQLAFREDSIGVFMKFLEALKADGDKATLTLKSMGLSGAETARTLLTLKDNVNLVKTRINQANVEFEKNTALNDEAAKAAEAFNAQMIRLGNNFTQIKRGIGQAVLPAINKFVTAMNDAFAVEPEKRLEILVTVGKAAFEDLAENLKVAFSNAFKAIEPMWNGLMRFFQESFSRTIDKILFEASRKLGSLNPFTFVPPGILEDRAREIAGQVRSLQDLINEESAAPIDFDPMPGAANTERALAEAAARAVNGNMPGLVPSDGPSSDLFPEGLGGSMQVDIDFLKDLQGTAEGFQRTTDETASRTLPTYRAELANMGSAVRSATGDLQEMTVVQAQLSEGQLAMMSRMTSVAGFFADAFSDGIRDWINGTKDAGDAFREMAAGILSDLGEMIVRQQLFNLISGSTSNSAGSPTGAFGSFFNLLGGITGLGGSAGDIPGFADGGRPPLGRLSIVGENGPEFFVPDAPGTVVPMSAGMGSGVVINQTNHFGSDLTRNEVLPLLEQNRQQTIAQIQEQNRLGGNFRRGLQR